MTGKNRPVHTETYRESGRGNPGRKGKTEAGGRAGRQAAQEGVSGGKRRAKPQQRAPGGQRGSVRQGSGELRREGRMESGELRRKRGTESGELHRSRKRPDAGGRNESGRRTETAEQMQRRFTDPGSPQGKRKPPEKKKKRKKTAGRYVKGILCVVLGAAVLCGAGIFLFETKEISVSGNQYCPEQEIVEWMKQDPYAKNTWYLFWKYNRKERALPPSVERVKVVLRSPQKVEVQVTEKVFAGRIDYQEQFLYFDRDGTVALVAPDVIDGVPYIEGMEVDAESIRIGEILPVADPEVFSEIGTLTELLERKELRPDKVSCTGTDLTLHFGGIQVQVGSGGFSEKLAQIPPILEKLNGLYAGQTGVLHLENYSISDGSIRFVPDTAAEG